MPRTLKEMALRYLRDKLESGELPPGTRLSDLSLSKEIGISRTPIREAIHQLASEGFVSIVPHVGAFVRQPDAREVEELYELRAVLEGHAARKAALRQDKELLQHLGETCSSMEGMIDAIRARQEENLTAEETREQRQLDLLFHETLIQASGNVRLVEMMQQFRILRRLFDLLESQMPLAVLELTCKYHRDIFEAISGGKADEAAHETSEHIQRGLSRMLARLEAWEADSTRHLPEALRKYAK